MSNTARLLIVLEHEYACVQYRVFEDEFCGIEHVQRMNVRARQVIFDNIMTLDQ